MAIAASVQKYLVSGGVSFELIEHARSLDSSHAAQAAHVPGDQLAKGTLLKDEQGFVIAVVPATRMVDLGAMHRRFGRPLGLATEGEVQEMFRDCEPGAVPPLGAAYGLESVLDDSLMEAAHVYFEAGDHQGLVHVSGTEFRKMMTGVPHGDISRHAQSAG
jgi:Ala-tRNA(Pro) deacylase